VSIHCLLAIKVLSLIRTSVLSLKDSAYFTDFDLESSYSYKIFRQKNDQKLRKIFLKKKKKKSHALSSNYVLYILQMFYFTYRTKIIFYFTYRAEIYLSCVSNSDILQTCWHGYADPPSTDSAREPHKKAHVGCE